MKKLTLEAGVPESQYNRAIEASSTLTKEILKERLDFLEAVEKQQYTEMYCVWALVPEPTWRMYLLLGQKFLEEQRLLRSKQRALKKAWREMYGL